MVYTIFSDLQLHEWDRFGYDKGTGMSKLMNDQVFILSQIANLNRLVGADACIFGGDWTQAVGEIPTSVLNVTNRHFKSDRTPYIFTEGNHDVIKRKNPLEIHRFVNILRSEANFVLLEFIDDNKIRTVDYTSNEEVENIKGNDIVVIHQMPAMKNEHGHIFAGFDWTTLAANNGLVFVGHYHHHKELADNCFIVGSPLKLTTDDGRDHGMFIVSDKPINENFEGYGYTKLIDKKVGKFYVVFIKLIYKDFVVVKSADEIKDDKSYYFIEGFENAVCDEDTGVMTAHKPKYFDTKIKSDSVYDVVNEYAALNGKPTEYVDAIKSILKLSDDNNKSVYRGRLSKIVVHDFMSIDDYSYEFHDGLVSMYGENGTGKTSIHEALYWCLFGKITKDMPIDDVVRDGCKDCSVSVILRNSDNSIIEIKRSRKKGIAVMIGGENVVDGMSDKNAQIFIVRRVLGFDSDIFLSSCYFSQESLIMLSNLGDSDRTNMINTILGFDVYDDLYDGVFQLEKDANLKLTKVQNDKAILDNNIRMFNNILLTCDEDVAAENSRVLSIKRDINITEYEIADLSAKVIKPLDVSEIAVIDCEVESLSAMVAGFRVALDSVRSSIVSAMIPYSTAYEEYNTCNSNNITLSARVKMFRDSVNNAKNIKYSDGTSDVVCNKCGSVVTKGGVSRYIEKLEAELAIADAEFAESKDKLDVVSKSYKEKEACINELKKSDSELLQTIESHNSKIANLGRKRSTIVFDVNESKNAYLRVENSIKLLESKNTERKNSIVEIEGSIAKKVVRRSGVVNDIVECNEKIVAVDNSINEIVKSFDVLKFWKEGFSYKGIKSLMLSKFCNDYNSFFSKYVSDVSSGRLSAYVSPISVTQGNEERNKISVVVEKLGIKKNYGSLSGGEKRRIDLATCLAMNRYIRKRFDMASSLLGVIILDEVLSYVDKNGEESIGIVLGNEGSDACVFVISYGLDMRGFASRSLHVKMINNISVIENL